MTKYYLHLKLFYCSLLFIFLQQFHLSAQTKSKEIYVQTQSWVSVNSTIRLSKKFGIIADLHVRRNNFFQIPAFILQEPLSVIG